MNLHAIFYQILVKKVALESCKICMVNYICGSLNKQRNEMIEVVLFVHFGMEQKKNRGGGGGGGGGSVEKTNLGAGGSKTFYESGGIQFELGGFMLNCKRTPQERTIFVFFLVIKRFFFGVFYL